MDGLMDGHTAAMRPMWQLMHLEQHLLTIWPHSNRNDNSISTSSSKKEGTQNSRHRLRDRLHFFSDKCLSLEIYFAILYFVSRIPALFSGSRDNDMHMQTDDGAVADFSATTEKEKFGQNLRRNQNIVALMTRIMILNFRHSHF